MRCTTRVDKDHDKVLLLRMLVLKRLATSGYIAGSN